MKVDFVSRFLPLLSFPLAEQQELQKNTSFTVSGGWQKIKKIPRTLSGCLTSMVKKLTDVPWIPLKKSLIT
jgi:hypothetical protein